MATIPFTLNGRSRTVDVPADIADSLGLRDVVGLARTNFGRPISDDRKLTTELTARGEP